MLFRARKAVNRAIALPKFPQRFNIDSLFLVQATAHFQNTDDFISRFRHQPRRI
jgi:hypothetical protein